MKKILLAIIIFINALSIAYSQCTPPSVVTITTPSIATLTICQGTAQPLSGAVTVTSASQNGGFTYSWIKMGLTSSSDVVLQTATIPLSINTLTAVPAYTGITGLVTNAGKYILRVEDGNTANASCFKDDTLTIVVNPSTTPGVIGASQTICTGENPTAFTQTIPASGGNGSTYTYVWERSFNGAAYSLIAGATSATYDEGVLTNAGTTSMTIDYRRYVTSGVCPQVTSNAVRITVNPTVVAGVITGNQTICSGGNPVAFTQTIAATGGTGVYTYQWQSSSVGGSGPWTLLPPTASNATYDAPSGLTATTYYRRVDASGSCVTASTNVITVYVAAALVPGNIAADQTICYNTVPAAFTSTAAATGGNGTYAYQWEISTTSGSVYTNIAGATNATFTPTVALTANRYYRRQVTSGTVATCNVAYTAEIHITVTPNFVVGSIGGTQTVCQSGNPTVLTSVTLPTGGNTAYTHQWKSSATAGGPYVNIAGVTNATYDPPAGIAATTYYSREDISAGGCGTLTTNEITVTVTPSVVPSVSIIATPATTICAGTSVTFTATPTNGGTPTYIWQKNAVSIPSATNSTYTTTGAQNGDSYSVHMTSTANCSSPATAVSNAIVMTVTTVVTPSVNITAVPGTTICAGTSVTFTATPGNGGTVPTYEWIINGASQGASSSTSSTFTSTTLTNGDQVSVRMTSSSGCVVAPGTATSNIITMTVATTVTPTVSIYANPSTICTNGSTTFTAVATNGGTAPVYQWYINGSPLGAASSSATYTTTALTLSSDQVEVRLLSNALCANPLTASAVMSITVNPGIGAGTIGSDQTICYNSTVATITQLTAPTGIVGTPTYQWEASVMASGPFTAIPGATSATYAPTISITQDVYIRRVTIDPGTPAPCNTATSNVVHITVRPQLVAGVIGSDETICSGTMPTMITQTTAPTGGTGTFTYQWQSDASGAFANIAGATSSSYASPALTATTRFERVETSGTCGTVTSNIVTKTVAHATAPTIHIDDPGQTCDGDIVLFKCQATNIGLAPIYNWYVNNNIVATVSTNSPTFTNINVEPLKAGDEVWVQLQSSSTCASTSSVISNKVIVNLIPCTVSNSIYTTSNVDILMQPYVSNSVPNVIDYTYFWSITDNTISTAVVQSQAQAGINVFPNPTTGAFNIEMPESGIDVTYEILDVTGRSVASGTFTSTVNDQQINADFGAGMYQVVLKYNNVVTCVRLSKVQ